MKVDSALIEHLGQLARLTIDAERIAPLAADLQEIIDHVATLPEFPKTAPTAQAPGHALRTDEVRPFAERDAALAAAPAREHGAFVVPKVLE
jgi:aspartyl-tRNA(Asn)/glutamyl-tRNA(Gln) amidotransferase subunit C